MKKYALLLTVGVVLLAVIVGGLFLAGSPRQARLERFDAERRSDIATLQNTLHAYWADYGDLPKDLTAVTSTQPYVVLPVDPETRQPYEYIRSSSSTFSLCAIFSTVEEKSNGRAEYFVFDTGFLRHGIGRTCFERTFTGPFDQFKKY